METTRARAANLLSAVKANLEYLLCMVECKQFVREVFFFVMNRVDLHYRALSRDSV